MNHPLFVRADMCRDGVIIALEAETHERRIQALEASLRCAEQLVKDLDAELNHLGRVKYALRYTHDLHLIKTSRDLDELKVLGRQTRDFKVCIVDPAGTCIWQNSPSQRFGSDGLEPV